MRALVIGDQEAIASEVRQILLASNRGYDQIDVAPLAGALDASSDADRDLFVLVLPVEAESALPILDTLCKATQSSIFVVGPTHDAKFVLRVLRQGADEYLDQAELKAELASSLDSIKAPHHAEAAGKGRVVGVLPAGGGAGGSTLAANLAVVLAKSNGQSALIDMRLGASDQESLLDLKPDHNLADLCRNIRRLDQNMFVQSLVRHASGAHLLAAPNAVEDVAAVTPQGVRQVVALARASFPYVVVNLDRVLRPEQLSAAVQVDVLLLLMRLEIASLRSARRLLDTLKKGGLADERVKIVASHFGQAKELPLRKVEQALGLAIGHQIPNAPADINLAGNKGVPVVVECPRAKVSKSIVKLAAAIRDFPHHRQNGQGKVDGLFARLGFAGAAHGGAPQRTEP
jgi:pilus assembly protein CpaE